MTAWDKDKLVELARCISDDSSIMYLQDILVLPNYHRRGIGKKLIQDCLKRFKHVRQNVLLTDNSPEQLRFYKSAGYLNVASETQLNAFVLFKK